MSVLHMVGIDPGLVHTGVVQASFHTVTKEVSIATKVMSLPNELTDLDRWLGLRSNYEAIYIEKYRPRAHLKQDADMIELEHRLKRLLPMAQLILNTGSKQVVRRNLMEALKLWKFATPTNHQDLRSAARIMLYGMLKNPDQNQVLSDFVSDILAGQTWHVRHV